MAEKERPAKGTSAPPKEFSSEEPHCSPQPPQVPETPPKPPKEPKIPKTPPEGTD